MRDLLDIVTAELLFRCDTYQNNIYSSSGCLVHWDQCHPHHPRIYRFMKKTKLGRWLEKRWTRRAHKRIAVK